MAQRARDVIPTSHNPRWLHLPSVSSPINLCLVRDIVFGLNIETQALRCSVVMAYNDLSGWPVTHTIDDPAIMRSLRELMTRESVWIVDGEILIGGRGRVHE